MDKFSNLCYSKTVSTHVITIHCWLFGGWGA